MKKNMIPQKIEKNIEFNANKPRPEIRDDLNSSNNAQQDGKATSGKKGNPKGENKSTK